MELMIPLVTTGGFPLYEQIYHYIKAQIKDGHLAAQDKLPSTRVLAKNLGVSRSTTQLAYDQLQAEGYIEAIPHKGYYIAQMEEMSHPLLPPKRELVTKSPRQDKDCCEVDFSPSGIDIKSFPYSVWRKITKNILVDGKQEVFLAGDPRGEQSLRETICKYLYNSRGVVCYPEQLIVGAGNEYLLMLLHQLLGSECIYAMENLTYIKAYKILRALGGMVKPILMDQSGMDLISLQESQANVAYVMPSHQYPTGVVMPVKRRQELLKWANARPERFLIEDDYDSEFRYKGKPIPALQGMDTSDKVVYIGTFSRAIAPAIRVGYMVLPQSLLARYPQVAGFYSSTVSRIDQNILTQFILEGHYERHLNRMRAVYRAKQENLFHSLRRIEDIVSIRGEDAGVHILLTHKQTITEQRMVDQALTKRVKVYGLSQYQIEPQLASKQGTVILGYASLTSEQISCGVDLLLQAWMSG